MPANTCNLTKVAVFTIEQYWDAQETPSRCRVISYVNDKAHSEEPPRRARFGDDKWAVGIHRESRYYVISFLKKYEIRAMPVRSSLGKRLREQGCAEGAAKKARGTNTFGMFDILSKPTGQGLSVEEWKSRELVEEEEEKRELAATKRQYEVDLMEQERQEEMRWVAAGCPDSVTNRTLKIIRDYHRKEREAEETQVAEAALPEKDRQGTGTERKQRRSMYETPKAEQPALPQ